MIGTLNSSSSRSITYKHGIELPTSVSHAKKLDEKNGSTRCMDTINRDIENLKVDFDVLEDGANIRVDHNKASGHLVFEVRMTLEEKYQWG